MDLGDFAGERSIGNVDNGANLDGLWEGPVGAGNARVVTFDGVVGDDLQRLSCDELNRLVVDEQSSADLRALRVKHDSASLVRALLECLSQVGHGLTVRLSVGKKSNKLAGCMEDKLSRRRAWQQALTL